MDNLDIQKYVPLKTVCLFFIDQYDKSNADLDKVWIIAFRALADLNFNIAAEPSTVQLPVNANKTVDLPVDYISWSKIGVVNDAGELSSLKVNNGLSPLRDTNANRLDYLTPQVNTAVPDLAGSPFFFNYFNNGVYNTLFGVGGGLLQFGDCRVDEKNKVIILNEKFQYTSILLEYIAAPQRNSDYMVETALQESIIAFIEWKMKVGTEQAYYARALEARRRLPGKRVTLQTINQVIRESTGFYLKA